MCKPGEYKEKTMYLGWKGLWLPAAATGKGGTMGGLCILAPSTVVMTAPPGIDSHILWEARAMAAHVHWGVAGGVIFINIYLYKIQVKFIQ